MEKNRSTSALSDFKDCLVIVAHPDDETLWAGGTILESSQANWKIITACRKSDPDRNTKFAKAAALYKADFTMNDLDDGPEQSPLNIDLIKDTISLSIDLEKTYDITLTHSPTGEYTRHRRHEEVSKAVYELWQEGKLKTKELWMFAYEDAQGRYLPRPIEIADIYIPLKTQIFTKKHKIITEIYGFSQNSFESETTPRAEAFWCFDNTQEIKKRFFKEIKDESSSTL